MALIQYVCPNCSGKLKIDNTRIKCKCDYCDTIFELDHADNNESTSRTAGDNFIFESWFLELKRLRQIKRQSDNAIVKHYKDAFEKSPYNLKVINLYIEDGYFIDSSLILRGAYENAKANYDDSQIAEIKKLYLKAVNSTKKNSELSQIIENIPSELNIQEELEEKRRKNKIRTIIIGVVIAVVAVILVLYAIGSDDKDTTSMLIK